MNYIYIDKLFNYFKYNFVPIVLIILSIYDLRTDLRLLFDFFTFSTLFYTLSEHPLAITVLIISPALFDKSKKFNH